MTKARINNLWTHVEGAGELDVEKFLRFKPKGYQFAPSYRANKWDGWIKLTRRKANQTGASFPTGLLELVKRQPWAQTWTFEEQRFKPACGFSAGAPWLYDCEMRTSLDEHQEAAVQAAIIAGRGIVQYPTGTGKGRILGETIRRLNLRTLVLVDKLDLLGQLHAELERVLGVEVGLIGGGHWDERDCTVATYQSIVSQLERAPQGTQAMLSRFHVVVVDEAHHADADTFAKVLQELPNAYFRLGFSATWAKSYTGKAEDRGTFLRVQSWLGAPIATMSISGGVDSGRIVPADVAIIHGCTPHKDRSPTNYKEEYQINIVENDWRNAAVHRLAQRMRKKGPTIILVDRIEHGERLAELFFEHAMQVQDPTIGLAFVSGSRTSAERAIIYEEFKRGKRDCLILSKIADEGLDLPNIEFLILAGGGNAPHRQIQRIGRALRASPGKEQATIFDFEDYGKYISAHYRRRRRTYDAEPAYTVVDIDRMAF